MYYRHPALIGLGYGTLAVVVTALLFTSHSTSSPSAPGVPRFNAPIVTEEPLLQLRRIEEGDAASYAVLEFSNPTDHAIYYFGYAPEHPQQWFEFHSAGRWVEGGWEWCGTGMNRHKLAPGRSVEFGVSLSAFSNVLDPIEMNLLDRHAPLRVGTYYGLVENAIDIRLWSDAIDVTEAAR